MPVHALQFFRVRQNSSWIAFVVLNMIPALAQAQAKPLVSITPTCATPRSHAPILFDANVRWDFPEVLEGTLHLEFYVAEKKVHTWISRELALSNSEIQLPVMAPAIILNDSNESLDIKVTFVSERKTYTYDDELNMLYWPDWKRVFVVGVVHPELSVLSSSGFMQSDDEQAGADLEWVRHFRLDSVLPHPKLSNHFVTRSVRVDPTKIASSPLELVSYDLLVITRDGLNALTQAQLDSIASWTEAGGALCVFGEQANSSRAQTFLKRVLDSDAVNPKVAFEEDGKSRTLLIGSPKWHLASPGIGRSLVTFQPVDSRQAAWKEAVLNLWRMRKVQQEHVLATGKWSYPEPKTGYKKPEDFSKSLENYLYHPMSPVPGADDVLAPRLMPNRVEGVPFRSVATLLFLCLLAVGPGDYFLLGFLGKRRWTWLLFPVIAIGFALYTIRLAQSHMGQTDHRNTLAIVDLTQAGLPARVSKFELLFAASEKQVTTERAQEFCVPIEHRYEMDPSATMVRGSASQDPMTYIGRAPVSYTIRRDVHQWQPQLSRSTLIGQADGVTLPQFDWQLVTAETLADETSRLKLMRQITDSIPEAQVMVLHQDQIFNNSTEQTGTPQNSVFPNTELTQPEELAKFITSVCSQGASGPFQVVSQLSPNFSGNLEDLALLDSTDPDQYLLLIIDSDKQGNHTVYRRLIRKNDS